MCATTSPSKRLVRGNQVEATRHFGDPLLAVLLIVT